MGYYNRRMVAALSLYLIASSPSVSLLSVPPAAPTILPSTAEGRLLPLSFTASSSSHSALFLILNLLHADIFL